MCMKDKKKAEEELNSKFPGWVFLKTKKKRS
jgi:ribosomal protein L39E